MTATATYRRPLVPEDLRNGGAAAASQSRSYWRLMTAQVLNTMQPEPFATTMERTWGREEAQRYASLTRAAATLATTTNTNMILPISVVGSLPILAPRSASAALSEKCLSLDFVGTTQVVVPQITTPPTAAWVAEGGGVSIVQPVFGQTLVGPPRKILFGAAVTADLAKYAPETAMPIIKATIIRAAIKGLDSALLDATSADTTRPAGLLKSVSDLGATAGGGLAALTADLGKLAAPIDAAGIFAEDLILLMNPVEAIKARGLLSPAFANTYTIVGTSAISSGTIVAIAPSAVATFFGAPELETATDGPVVHMDDVPGADIIVAGGAPVTGGSVKSAWQSNLILLKLRLRCTWAPLSTAAIQKIDSVTW